MPQGGNTSLCEGAIPRSGDVGSVVINLRRMRQVRSIDAVNNSVEVQAGCVLAQVQQAAAEHGRLYPVSLGAEGSCQIGGNIATNAGGTGVLRYGNTRDNVLGVEAVLPDGRIWDGLYRLRKNNTGFDLKHLFIGSEGTLGVITAATLKLHPLPTSHAVAWMALGSPQAALSMLMRFQQRCGGVLSAFEMMNDVELKIVLDHVPGRRAPLTRFIPVARARRTRRYQRRGVPGHGAARSDRTGLGQGRRRRRGHRLERTTACRLLGSSPQRLRRQQEGGHGHQHRLRGSGVRGARVHRTGHAKRPIRSCPACR